MADSKVDINDLHLMHERIAQRDLDDAEKAMFSKAGLLRLYKIMQKPVDEGIAVEAVQNYDSDKKQTIIRKVKVTIDQGTLRQVSGADQR